MHCFHIFQKESDATTVIMGHDATRISLWIRIVENLRLRNSSWPAHFQVFHLNYRMRRCQSVDIYFFHFRKCHSFLLPGILYCILSFFIFFELWHGAGRSIIFFLIRDSVILFYHTVIPFSFSLNYRYDMEPAGV